MNVGILLSGGKDSVYAAHLVAREHELACAITIRSENEESYMFHTPNIELTALQAKAMGIPHIIVTTKGEKEKELAQLEDAIEEAVEKHGVQGIVTGAVASKYQASRVQRICDTHGLRCFNPLWQIDQMRLLNELLENEFEVMIVGVFAYPFTEELLGKRLDRETLELIETYARKYEINPAGEGGEIETLVTDCPLFSERITVQTAQRKYDNYAGTYRIEQAKLESKK